MVIKLQEANRESILLHIHTRDNRRGGYLSDLGSKCEHGLPHHRVEFRAP